MRYLEIDKKGKIVTFKGDFTDLETQLKTKKEKRLSWIAPKKWPRLWIILRRFSDFFGLKRVSSWLKNLNTEWVLIVDGKIIASFRNRDEAIRYEKEYFIKKFKNN